MQPVREYTNDENGVQWYAADDFAISLGLAAHIALVGLFMRADVIALLGVFALAVWTDDIHWIFSSAEVSVAM